MKVPARNRKAHPEEACRRYDIAGWLPHLAHEDACRVRPAPRRENDKRSGRMMRTLLVIANRFFRCRGYKWLRRDWGKSGSRASSRAFSCTVTAGRLKVSACVWSAPVLCTGRSCADAVTLPGRNPIPTDRHTSRPARIPVPQARMNRAK